MTKAINRTLWGAFLAVSFAAPAIALPPPDSGAEFPARVLAAHNQARMVAGVSPLQWDPQLGTEAAKYALQLAINNIFAHSVPAVRRNAGENLWMGTRGAFGLDAMVSSWVSEGRHFRPGVFPAVSSTGNWQDVGHFTQVVWPDTRRVGCALATNARNDYLVCRYWPAGNVIGVSVRTRMFEPARLGLRN